MEILKRRAVNFDLDSKKMKAAEVYPLGYYQLRQSLKEEGFEHRQGSGYISGQKIRMSTVYATIEKIVDRHPWFADCVRTIDVTEVGKNFDMTSVIKGLVFGAATVQQETSRETENVAADEFDMEE